MPHVLVQNSVNLKPQKSALCETGESLNPVNVSVLETDIMCTYCCLGLSTASFYALLILSTSQCASLLLLHYANDQGKIEVCLYVFFVTW